MSSKVLEYVARGLGVTEFTVEGTESEGKSTGPYKLTVGSEAVFEAETLDKGIEYLVKKTPEAPPADGEEGAEYTERIRAFNYSLQATEEEAMKVVTEFNTRLSENPSFLSGEDKPALADLLLFAALQDFMATSTPPQKGSVKFLMGYIRRVGKFTLPPKPTTPQKPEEPQRPLDDVTRFKLVVGKVVKVWHHPEADGLYCEEVEIGEEKPRQIATGIRKYYPQEEFENSMVVILANMKPRALRGFNSEGMVMCASNPEHTVVKPIRPPANAKPGDLVTFDGFVGGPPDDVLKTKKGQESIPAVLPHLKTNDSCVPMYKEHRWLVGGEPLSCPEMPNCTIS